MNLEFNSQPPGHISSRSHLLFCCKYKNDLSQTSYVQFVYNTVRDEHNQPFPGNPNPARPAVRETQNAPGRPGRSVPVPGGRGNRGEHLGLLPVRALHQRLPGEPLHGYQTPSGHPPCSARLAGGSCWRSSTIWVCLSCEMCSTYCPNEVAVSAVISHLRNLAFHSSIRPKEKLLAVFHQTFLEQLQKFGRVNEFWLMEAFNRHPPILKEKIKAGTLQGRTAAGAGALAERQAASDSPAFEGHRGDPRGLPPAAREVG